MLLLELFVGLAAIYIGAAVVFLLLLSTPLALISAAAKRVDRREGRNLRWSAQVEDVAKALVAEQALSFRVAHRRALMSRELEFLFLPLAEVRHLSNVPGDIVPGQWHVFSANTRRGCITTLPVSGRDLATKLVGSGPDAVPAAEALDCLMSTLCRLSWSLA